MKKNTTVFAIWIIFFILIGINIFIFLSGMKLSEKINYFETETKRLRTENVDLEKKAYEASSLQHAASVAAQLDFKKKAEPYFLDSLRYALKAKE